MTVALAVRKNGRTVLAADSLVNFGGQRFPEENCRFHKIYRVDDSVVAWAGWSLYAELLSAHLANTTPKPLTTEAEIFDFFVSFWRSLRTDYAFNARRKDGWRPFGDLDSVFVLANRSGIFRVSDDMDVTQFTQYIAVGTGSRYALGALRILYDQLDDAAEIARRAAQVGIDFDVYCGGEIDLIEV